MQLIVFIGLQGSGKSTFFAERFVNTHVRINLDMLRTRHRETLLFEACLAAKQPMVIDNTNPTIEQRVRYIAPARTKGFGVEGYYFRSDLEGCLRRNAGRSGREVVPNAGLLGTSRQLVRPTLAEGFDRLHYVRIDDRNGFVVEEWSDEIR